MTLNPKEIIGRLFGERGLGRFELFEAINTGPMSDIHRAMDKHAGRILCLKLYNRDGQVMREAIEQKHPGIREMLTSIHHPNILHVFEIAMAGKRMYAVMEYIDGTTIGKIMRKEVMPFRWWLGIIKQVVTGMRYLHEEVKLVHRDFNPYNVMLTRDNVVKIVDLDFAYPIGSDARGLYRRSGTLGYMAPEQVKGLMLDERVDVYSFGASLYEIFVGVNPFRDRSSGDERLREERTRAKHLQVAVRGPSTLNSSVPPEFDEIVLKCLQRARLDRYNNFAEIQSAIKAFEAKLGIEG